MTIRTAILDFDGTCTEIEQEAQGFLAGYKRDLATHLGLTDLSDSWQIRERQVLAAPSRHGMVMKGRLVAPPVDLYLLATAVGGLLAPELDDAAVERLFHDNYRFTTCHFKPETKAVVEALAASPLHLHIVTNSDPAAVSNKLDHLAPTGRARIRLHGNARKFALTEPQIHTGHTLFNAVPETLSIRGWDRPVHPRRGHYFDALTSIWKETGTSPAETVVIGDVFELDLALPATLGCSVHLTEGPRTLDYEREAVSRFGGRHDPDLRAVLDYLP